ncbi:MAG: hypothetical protein R8K22_09160 [Mariprofundaceae bacterium]
MKNVFFMSVFALFMTMAFAGQSVSDVSFVAPAYADNDEETTSAAFSCPEGITTCYRADGSEYTDVNNLSATAAGHEHESHDSEVENAGSAATYAKPSHYRSF